MIQNDSKRKFSEIAQEISTCRDVDMQHSRKKLNFSQCICQSNKDYINENTPKVY